jgi:hypothetical protein
MGTPLERDESVLMSKQASEEVFVKNLPRGRMRWRFGSDSRMSSGPSGGSRHLRKGIGCHE